MEIVWEKQRYKNREEGGEGMHKEHKCMVNDELSLIDWFCINPKFGDAQKTACHLWPLPKPLPPGTNSHT